MLYLQVKWTHTLVDEPVLLLSELSENRHEIRKIEIYADGRVGFAGAGQATGGTRLSETPLPAADEIGADPQFAPESITRAKFEEAWEEALAQGS